MEAAIKAVRRATGKAGAKECRKHGLVPAVLYGKSMTPEAIALDIESVKRILRRSRGHVHHIVMDDPHFEGDVMVQDVLHEPISGQVRHMDLHRISLTEKVRTEVAIDIIGGEAIEKNGLLLQRQSREVTVECLPGDIPALFSVDVSAMSHGDSVTAGDLEMPAGVRLVTSPMEVLVVVLSPKSAEEETTDEGDKAEAETTAEPEEGKA